MVEGVESSVLNDTVALATGGSTAQRDESARIKHARDLAQTAIAQIRNNPSIPPEEKRTILDELEGAMASGDASKIMASVDKAGASADYAEATQTYEMIGNMEVSREFMTENYDLGSSRGRENFARGLAGPGATRGEVATLSNMVERDPETRAMANEWNSRTPEQRRAAEDNRAQNVNQVGQEAGALLQNTDLGEEARRNVQRLSSDSHYAGRDEAVQLLRNYRQNHDEAALRDGVAALDARREHHRQSARANRAPGATDAEVNAAGDSSFDLEGLNNHFKKGISQNITKQNGYAALENNYTTWHELNTGDDASRVKAYVDSYTAVHKGETINTAALTAAATKYVDDHDALDAKAVREALTKPVMAQMATERAAAGGLADAHQVSVNVWTNTDKLLDHLKVAQSTQDEIRDQIVKYDTTENMKTYGKTISTGFESIAAGDAAGIDRAGHDVGTLVAGSTSSVVGPETSQQAGAAAESFAQGAGHMLAGMMQHGREMQAAAGDKPIEAGSLLADAAPADGKTTPATDQPTKVEPAATTTAATDPAKVEPAAETGKVDTAAVPTGTAQPTKVAEAAPSTAAPSTAAPATATAPLPEATPNATAPSATTTAVDAARNAASSAMGWLSQAAKTATEANAKVAKEEGELSSTLKGNNVEGHIDPKTHEFISADGKQHLKLTGDASKDLIAIQKALHGADVKTASNDSNAPPQPDAQNVPNIKVAQGKPANAIG